MSEKSFHETVSAIIRDDPRYREGAYVFVRMALDYTSNKLRPKSARPEDRNVSGGELLEGVREFALSSFGPMAMPLFGEWGIQGGEDIGNIVFNLVEAGFLRKDANDTIEDFTRCYNFRDAFEKPFEPKGAKRVSRRGKKR